MFERHLGPRGVVAAALTIALTVASVLVGAGSASADVVKDNLYGASFVSAEVGWVCGAFGTIARTRDGGNTWQAQSSGTLEQLFSIDFVNDRLGWAVGRSGTIVHTADAGDTWTAQTSPSDKHLFAVDFLDETHGVAVGDWGVILVTDDGGRVWQDRSLTEDVILNSVAVTGRGVAMIVGEIGSIFHTEDGGSSWTRLTSGVEKTLFGLRCIDSNRCWAVGIDALILRSDDAGATWRVLNGSVEMRALSQVGFGQAFENPSLYSIDVDGEFGVAAGEIGSIFVSRDGGNTWKRLEASKNWALPWFRDLELVDDHTGIVVGARGHRVMIREGRIEFDVEGD